MPTVMVTISPARVVTETSPESVVVVDGSDFLDEEVEEVCVKRVSQTRAARANRKTSKKSKQNPQNRG